jgi:GT2 family glycosyltransferase
MLLPYGYFKGERNPKLNAEILCICVNYGNEADTLDYVSDLLSQEIDLRVEIIIVDNYECDREKTLLKDTELVSDTIEIYRSGSNLGYFGGAKWALEEYLVASAIPEWIIVSNSDIRLARTSFLSTLVDLHKRNAPEVIAPKVISGLTGLNQNPHFRHRPSSWKIHSYKSIYRFRVIFSFYRLLHIIKSKFLIWRKSVNGIERDEDKPCTVYAPHGSIVIFNGDFFVKGGTLDYGSFLFGEEIFIAETASSLGLNVLYEPRLVAFHREHATTKMSKEMLRYKYESAKYCASEYFSRAGVISTKRQ